MVSDDTNALTPERAEWMGYTCANYHRFAIDAREDDHSVRCAVCGTSTVLRRGGPPAESEVVAGGYSIEVVLFAARCLEGKGEMATTEAVRALLEKERAAGNLDSERIAAVMGRITGDG